MQKIFTIYFSLASDIVCPFPIIECLFYSILTGEQDGMFASKRYYKYKLKLQVGKIKLVIKNKSYIIYI